MKGIYCYFRWFDVFLEYFCGRIGGVWGVEKDLVIWFIRDWSKGFVGMFEDLIVIKVGVGGCIGWWLDKVV